MTALITLTDSIIAPDGEEYRAVWGEVIFGDRNITIGGGVVCNRQHIISLLFCLRPQKETTEYTETKNGRLPHTSQTFADFPHIYYAE